MLNILFLCTGNSCRSQMAEAIARNLYPQHQFFSAGIETHGMNPYAIKVCNELGLDMSMHSSKHIDTFKDIKFDLVLTVCDHANESCPIFTGLAQKLHHSFQDPPKLATNLINEEEKLTIYRQVRDEIKTYLQNELPQLVKSWK
ncbi:arsenate reductase ArsC [Aquella oligotrophica]|uniref:Arsenate reductase n=1 Tax=Aquella oligotrophica TaxID=2067065 RepID=A0A2I7N7I1_9NEIS|nr:arsenate reductase ArsC [Aquella oligotrophica]AUR52414.1 arsenate reductase [Aquella oligotrophica]